jgi:uncharacterized membrane protein YvbJ|tara:strand:- start:2247 stop:2684 length:438 start_codon:yes stop_codon:yes gene_type:complete
MALSKEDQKELRQDTADIKKTEEVSVPNKKSKKWVFVGIVLVIIVLIGSFSIVNANKPGPLDDFAKCLSEKDAVMYGALSWCKYTQAQKAMFGKSFNHLNYIDYTEYPEEQFGKIKKTPTWIINGKAYENVISIDKLSQLSGCEI